MHERSFVFIHCHRDLDLILVEVPAHRLLFAGLRLLLSDVRELLLGLQALLQLLKVFLLLRLVS